MSGDDATIRALIGRGVVIPRPDLVAVDPAVDPRAFEAGAEIHAGARIEGARTIVGAGSRLGTAGPVVVRNCALGRSVELASGTFEDAVFLDGSSFGPGGFARGGTLFEERARAAHAVGTKHTILLPFATLGSLINFCDCLLAGGTSESDHSEVGSGFIHFNFTPAGDKATASAFGDVARGVFLRERAIFLGGHAGAVGPVRVGFGTVLAAGGVLRRDAGEGVLVTAEPPRPGERPFDAAVVRGARAKVRRNLDYLADLAALLAFHRQVRAALARGDAHREALATAAAGAISGSIAERVRQLDRFAALVGRAPREAGAADGDWERRLGDRLAAVAPGLAAPGEDGDLAAHRGAAALRGTIARGGDYVAWVRALGTEAVRLGTEWLTAVRTGYLAGSRSAGIL